MALEPPRTPSTRQPRLARSKNSFHYEADDEYTVSGSPSMGPAGEPDSAQYAGEDTRLTSKKELAGFYSYGWAAEVFVICGMGSFIPITLEQLARENGWLESDPARPCVGPHTPSLSEAGGARDPRHGQCVVDLFGAEINTASFAMYTFSISVLLQALLIMSMSGAADHGPYRKQFLLMFAFTGAIATMLFLPVVPKLYILAAFFAIVANTCFGASFVLLNSFLPLLVRHHPTVQLEGRTLHDGQSQEGIYSNGNGEEDPFLQPDDSALDGIADATTPLLPDDRADYTSAYKSFAAAPSQELQLSTKISSNGIGIGYMAGLIVQIACIIMVGAMRSSTFSLRLSLFIIGVWWFLFSIPSIFWLRPRPGPPLHISRSTGKARTCFAYFTYSWKSLGRTITHARGLKDILLFLAAWFLLSDSIATVSGTAILFAKTSLDMQPPSLALISLIGTVAGVVGAFTWSRISAMMGLKPSQTILACICLFEVIPVYGLLGYIPAVQRLGYLGLQRPWEMYPLGAIYGFVLGGLSSYCRSLFGELIPPGFEAAFYALYAITDKGSSIFGPAIVGAITDATGDIRPAFWFLAVLVGLPFPLMLMVDVERGRADGIAMAKELEDGKLQKSLASEDGSDVSIRLEEEDDEEMDTPRRSDG